MPVTKSSFPCYPCDEEVFFRTEKILKRTPDDAKITLIDVEFPFFASQLTAKAASPLKTMDALNERYGKRDFTQCGRIIGLDITTVR